MDVSADIRRGLKSPASRPTPDRVEPAASQPGSISDQLVLSKPPKSKEDEWNFDISKEFLAGGARYAYSKSIALIRDWWRGLEDVPHVKLNKPLMVVQGFATTTGQFETLLDHLCEDGRNGGRPVYVKEGQFFSDPDCEDSVVPTAENKVFRMISGREDTPELTAQNMKKAIDSLTPIFGEDPPDVIAHSLGGLGARLYCDQGNKLGKLCLVGTPNQGARVALVTKAALVNDISWACALAKVTPAALPALEWMVPVAQGNEKLEELNADLDKQIANTDGFMILGATDFDTPSSTEASEPGDGLIEASSVQMNGAETNFFEGTGTKNHYTQVNDPDFVDKFIDFFAWEKDSTS